MNTEGHGMDNDNREQREDSGMSVTASMQHVDVKPWNCIGSVGINSKKGTNRR